MNAAEATYVTSLEELFWSGTLIAVTMAVHGVGMVGVLRANHALKYLLASKVSLIRGIVLLILTSWLILAVHISEVIIWASFFLWKGAFPNHSLAFYFSLNEYTTVGSNFNLPLHWRLLEGSIATAGLLTFAWSTGILLTLAQEFQDQHMELFKQRYHRKSSGPAPGQSQIPAA